MIVLGLCGTSGSGKSTVSLCFRERGAAILDCDVIYHELISKPTSCLRAIGREFGADLIRSGSLDRAALREIVYHDEKKRLKLNRLTHAFVKRELKSRMLVLRSENAPVCVIDAPLLFEARLDAWCDAVVGVFAPLELRVDRLMRRDGISREAAELRLSKQIPPEELEKKCRFRIENDGDLSALQSAVDRILKEFSL